MNDPEELKKAPLPEDLKLLFHELKVPENDPILPLLGWLWTQLNQTTNTVADARMALMAALDTRLVKVTTAAELLAGISQQLEATKAAMATLHTEIGPRVHRELQTPIENSVALCDALALLLDRLLHRTTDVLAHARRQQVIAILAAGFVSGVLTGLCLSSLGFLHR